MSDGDYYGVSRLAEIPPRSLTATDLDGLELQPERFRLYLRARLGITSGGATWDKGELLELGFLDVGGHQIYAVYALQQPQPGVGDKLRARANGASSVLLFPSPQVNGTTELAQVMLESAVPEKQALIRQSVYACGFEGSVPAIHTSGRGPARCRYTDRKGLG